LSLLEDVPPELYNNIAVLHHLDGNLAAASAMYEKALEKSNESGQSATNESNQLSALRNEQSNFSIHYNVARLYEAKGEYAKSEIIYEQLLKRHPNYTDGKNPYLIYLHFMQLFSIWIH